MIKDGRDYDMSEIYFFDANDDIWDEIASELNINPGADGVQQEFDLFSEPTVEIKCTCGTWAVYGKTDSLQLHQEYCDLRRK